jgi:hypothetical protein
MLDLKSVLIALVVVLGLIVIIIPSPEAQKRNQCLKKTKVERALRMCALTPGCDLSLSDMERLIDICQACSSHSLSDPLQCSPSVGSPRAQRIRAW